MDNEEDMDNIDELINFANNLLETTESRVEDNPYNLRSSYTVDTVFEVQPSPTEIKIKPNNLNNEGLTKKPKTALELHFEKVVEIASSVFGSDKVSFMKNSEDLNELVVHFPRITIHNSKGYKHTLRDLFVRFLIKEDGKFKSEIQGTRTTLLINEFNVNYTHSHLSNTSSSSSYQTFCLGYDSLRLSLEKVASFDISTFDYNFFEMFLYEVNEYVRWESLEGGPYNTIQAVSNNSGRINTNPRISQSLKDELLKILLMKIDNINFLNTVIEENIEHLTVNYDELKGKINLYLKQNPEEVKDIIQCLVERLKCPAREIEILFVKEVNSGLSEIRSEQDSESLRIELLSSFKIKNNSVSHTNKVRFNNELVPLRIYKKPKLQSENDNMYLNVILKDHIISVLNDLLQNILYKIYE